MSESPVPLSVVGSSIRVVVVGGSAGGLEALTSMLGAVGPRSGWCIVVAQHMSPSASSGLTGLLDRATSMDVVEATDGAPFRTNTVFVAPPGRDIVVSSSAVGIENPDAQQRPWPSVDRLFLSAATSFGERSIAVVLSGTGNDGAAGVEAIEAAGGVVAVQDVGSASFESMPSASFATGSVDIQAAAEEIPRALERFLGSAQSPPAHAQSADSVVIEPALLNKTIATLHQEVGVDFSGYKHSTLQRQITRRKRLLAMNDTASYVAHLRSTPIEAESLARALLVTVTAFFRDEDVWEGLRQHLDEEVGASGTDQFRIWVPGCASGEEAYTIAMLTAEALGSSHDDLSGRMKIFATDLDERALDIARRGRYSRRAAEGIPDRLRRRWTRETGDEIEVLPALRESIVFARHNVAFDPPFPTLNLVSLRNTLIYFQPRLQERVLQLCHFALLPNGLLLLGQSERVPRTDEMFVVVDQDRRLYRRRQHSRLPNLSLGGNFPSARVMRRQEPFDIRSRGGSADQSIYRDIVKAVMPAALILDDRSVLVEVIGDVAAWCTVNEGSYSGNVVDLLKGEYRSAVRAMLSQLRHSAPAKAVRRIRTNDGTTQISVTRIEGHGSISDAGSIVSFDSGPDLDDTAQVDSAAEDGAAAQVSVELESVYDALQATVEDLSSSNEELQALNEELQASSEELQASSEEVQASNEELEASNEELTTLNQELSARGADLTHANNDLENIQSSLTNGLVLLDLDLHVLRYTPLAVRLFSLIPSDLGRRLTVIPTTIPVPGLDDALEQTLAGKTQTIELGNHDRDLLVQTQPYLGEQKEILGAIVVVIDVSDITAERRLRERASANLEMVTESIRATVWQRDSSGGLSLLTHRVEDMYGLDHDLVVADPSLLLSSVHPDDRDRVASTSASADPSWDIRYRINRPDGAIRWIHESAVLIQPPDGSPPVRVGSSVDVTEQQDLADENHEQSQLLETLFRSESLGIILVDGNGNIERTSSAVDNMTAFSSAALAGRTLSSLLPEATVVRSDTGPSNGRMLRADGHSTPVAVEFHPFPKKVGHADPRTVVIVHDSTQLRRISAELAAHEQFDQQTGLLTRTYFRASAAAIVESTTENAAALWIDLDGFKEVNDRLGHRSGDRVLGVIATRLQRAVRDHQLVGRLGGDEFAVLLGRVGDLDALDNMVHRILAAIREPVVIDDTHAFVTASIGVAVQPQDGNTAEELLHNADVAMYSAKQAGRDQHVYFTSEMDRQADTRAELRHQLATAVRHRDFELHYQTIRSTATGQIVMLEALARWRRDGNVVTASEFIDLAAETGQLRSLGHIILDCLVADVQTLYDRFGADHPKVAVNLSASELRERGLMDQLLSWHPAAGFGKIVVEVTEQVTLVPGDRAFETLALLRRLGATISIDDFGTGYSNLDLLGKLKPGIIKIDRSLLESAAVDERGERILEAAVQLAHALETTPVIEGVGTAELLAVAAGTGADYVQGYHLGRPMPLDTVIETIAAGV